MCGSTYLNIPHTSSSLDILPWNEFHEDRTRTCDAWDKRDYGFQLHMRKKERLPNNDEREYR